MSQVCIQQICFFSIQDIKCGVSLESHLATQVYGVWLPSSASVISRMSSLLCFPFSLWKVYLAVSEYLWKNQISYIFVKQCLENAVSASMKLIWKTNTAGDYLDKNQGQVGGCDESLLCRRKHCSTYCLFTQIKLIIYSRLIEIRSPRTMWNVLCFLLAEKTLVHELFMSLANPKELSFTSKKMPENSVWMEETKLKNLIICHPEVHTHTHTHTSKFFIQWLFFLAAICQLDLWLLTLDVLDGVIWN